jgi:hypothetical protein
MSKFSDDLVRVINYHGVDGKTNIPDYVLARLIEDFVNTVEKISKEKEKASNPYHYKYRIRFDGDVIRYTSNIEWVKLPEKEMKRQRILQISAWSSVEHRWVNIYPTVVFPEGYVHNSDAPRSEV